ncbi:hypothetical protein AKKGGB_AKKGGB_13820, partial [Dysosmobacter welbionis]
VCPAGEGHRPARRHRGLPEGGRDPQYDLLSHAPARAAGVPGRASLRRDLPQRGRL